MTDTDTYLIKACDRLRLTNQIRLQTFMAMERGLRLHLHVRNDTQLSGPLRAFVDEHGAFVSIERQGR
jgi:hypothetical protein